MGVAVAVVMLAVMAVAQQKGADEIDGEAKYGDQERFAIGNRDRMHQPLRAFKRNLDRDDRQNDGAGKGGKVAELSGAEGEFGVAGLASREQIGQRGDAERRGMGRHVPAVGQQRHRSEQRSRHDLADHHDRGQRHHEPGAALVARMFGTEEDMIVGPLIERM